MGQTNSSQGAVSPIAESEQGSKDPVIYLLGRSGHGKTSIVNALASQAANPVPTRNTTSEKWNVIFTDGTTCTLVESHGMFEHFPNSQDSFTRKLEEDLTLHKPCVILYVLSCNEVKSAAKDFEILKEFFKSNKKNQDRITPVYVVLTKTDAYFDKRLWPIGDHVETQILLTELLDYISKEILSANTFEPVQNDSLYCGYVMQGCGSFQGIIPTATLLNGNELSWNIDKVELLLTKAQNKDEQPYDFQKDSAELQKIQDEIKGMFEILCNKNNVVGTAYEKCRKAALQPLVEFLENFIEKAREPIIYLMGRSGHGKSSLINALTNSDQAEVGHVEPTTPKSKQYDITFTAQNAAWKIVDSRGIFETTTVAGATGVAATTQVVNDLNLYKPDVILHVINCSEARNLAADLEFVNKTFKTIKLECGQLPPIIIVLTKADAFYHPAQWPIEEHAEKQKALEKLLEYMATPILSSGTREFLDSTAKFYGCQLKGCEPFLYVVPVATLRVEPPRVWNTDRLNELIGEKLPIESWLHFYRTQKRQKSMRELAFKVVNKMIAISSAIAAIPIPGLSFVFLVPLYVIMVSLIAKLSGREFSTTTAKEFLKTCKLWQGVAIAGGVAAGTAFLAMAEVLETILFGVGCLISVPVTAATTYGVGKAAIAYFFDNEIKAPESFKKEWAPPQT